jgi:hypothetical protein
MLLTRTPPVKSQQKTANAVEGKVCPDRLSQQFVAVAKFFESAEKDTNSPLILARKSPLNLRNSGSAELNFKSERWQAPSFVLTYLNACHSF